MEIRASEMVKSPGLKMVDRIFWNGIPAFQLSFLTHTQLRRPE